MIKAGNELEYKGYTTFVNYSAEDDCLYSKIEGIRSVILFDNCETPIVNAFHEAVDDYLAWCEEEGSEPEKPYKGLFNVRIGSDLHRKLAIRANNDNDTLNRAVEKAIELYVA